MLTEPGAVPASTLALKVKITGVPLTISPGTVHTIPVVSGFESSIEGVPAAEDGT